MMLLFQLFFIIDGIQHSMVSLKFNLCFIIKALIFYHLLLSNYIYQSTLATNTSADNKDNFTTTNSSVNNYTTFQSRDGKKDTLSNGNASNNFVFGIWDYEMTRLRRDLLQNYDKNNRPVDQKFRNTTEIYISFFMRYINEFDEVAGHLKSTVGIQVYWKDRRLAWDPGNYSGFKDSLTFNLKDLWVPHVTLWNPVDTFIILDPENDQLMVAVEAEESLVHYLIGGVITTHCVPNVKYFPFDSHTCEINLIMYESAYFFKGIQLQTLANVHLKYEFFQHPRWHIHKENSSVVEIMGFSIAKFPYVLRRRPMFMLFNLLIPILLLSFLNICVFAIPIQSGERTSFSITVFLALAVFMTVVADHVPHSSSPMPLWSIFLLFKLVFSASIALCSTFVIRMFHRSHLRQIPTVLVWIAGVWDKLHDLCSSRPKKNVAGKEENNSSITLPDDYGSTIIHDWSDHSSLSSSGQLTWPHVAYVIDKLFLVLFLSISITETTVTFIITVYRLNI